MEGLILLIAGIALAISLLSIAYLLKIRKKIESLVSMDEIKGYVKREEFSNLEKRVSALQLESSKGGKAEPSHKVEPKIEHFIEEKEGTGPIITDVSDRYK